MICLGIKLRRGKPALVETLARWTKRGVWDCEKIVQCFKIVWEFEDKKDKSQFLASPAIASNIVIVGSSNKSLYAIALDSGKLIWKIRTQGEITTSAILTKQLAIFATKNGRLYILNIRNGKCIGKYDLGEHISASPAMANGKIIIGTEEGTIFALELKGNE